MGMVHCITMAGLPRLGTGGGGATAELSTFGTSVKSTVRRHLGPGWDGGLQLLLSHVGQHQRTRSDCLIRICDGSSYSSWFNYYSAMATQFPLGTEVYSQICITGSTVPLGDLTQQTNLQQPGGPVPLGGLAGQPDLRDRQGALLHWQQQPVLPLLALPLRD